MPDHGIDGPGRWLQNHYDEPVRMQDLADHVGLNVSSLNRNFRA